MTGNIQNQGKSLNQCVQQRESDTYLYSMIMTEWLLLIFMVVGTFNLCFGLFKY